MRPTTRPIAWRRLVGVAILVAGLDQLTKALVRGTIERGDEVEVLPFLDLVHVLNEGVAFGLLGGSSVALMLSVTFAALALVLGWFTLDPLRAWGWLAVGLLAGGAVGNLVDRVRIDGVTDFIDLPAWPSFNLADVAITAGAVVLVLVVLSGDDEDPAPTPATSDGR